jgi:hypothetical protein
MPPMRKYVFERSNRGERTSARIVDAAFISDSPVVSWQMEPSERQCAAGKMGLKPGTVMFSARRLPMPLGSWELVYQMSASGGNWWCESLFYGNKDAATYHAYDEDLGGDFAIGPLALNWEC